MVLESALSSCVAEYKKCRPSGRNQGKRCPTSLSRILVTVLTVPPPAGMRSTGLLRLGANRITPLALPAVASGMVQVPPRPAAASASVSTGPPVASIRLSLPFAKKPMDLLSGDQNG